MDVEQIDYGERRLEMGDPRHVLLLDGGEADDVRDTGHLAHALVDFSFYLQRVTHPPISLP